MSAIQDFKAFLRRNKQARQNTEPTTRVPSTRAQLQGANQVHQDSAGSGLENKSPKWELQDNPEGESDRSEQEAERPLRRAQHTDFELEEVESDVSDEENTDLVSRIAKLSPTRTRGWSSASEEAIWSGWTAGARHPYQPQQLSQEQFGFEFAQVYARRSRDSLINYTGLTTRGYPEPLITTRTLDSNLEVSRWSRTPTDSLINHHRKDYDTDDPQAHMNQISAEISHPISIIDGKFPKGSLEAPVPSTTSPVEPFVRISNVDDEDDRRSIQYENSSMTLVSTSSGFTAVEMESATVELQKVFQEDADLVRLYRSAIKDTSIGPERLQRNVGRLLKVFAQDLRHEASKDLES